ncbi:septum site-determining protein MinC [Paludibacterium paludis]|uniref:Probable septum site-determining protein MinC n=1 Tax=Paludibacterium paludis TaxID=1225769 RepID=A0A918NWM5_9NEIS|nr:septum site-determining protein MinC [Paludibacterium paludis]GGY02881.1 putative septum site-determining protein MinC [Paludibacterium paludis]
MSQTANAFDIKSASIDVLAIVLRTAGLEELGPALRARFGTASAEAGTEPFVLDLEMLDEPTALDMQGLLALLAESGIHVVGLRHPDPAFAELASRHALAWLPVNAPRPAQAAAEPAKPAEPAAPPAGPESIAPMIIDRPVRAGQQIYARGGDLVVLAVVSAGAEIIADGNIHVYAPLRGRALAGARGNTSARIFVRAMEAELVSIAGVYRTIEQALPDSLRGKPTQIYLENERIVMSALGE